MTRHGAVDVQLRESEEFNRSLMDASPDCVKVLDLDGRVLHINTPGLCAMEIDDFGSVCGQQWEALWPEGAQRDIERSVARAIRCVPSGETAGSALSSLGVPSTISRAR